MIIIILAVVVAAIVDVFIVIEIPMLLLPVVINFNSVYFMINKGLSL